MAGSGQKGGGIQPSATNQKYIIKVPLDRKIGCTIFTHMVPEPRQAILIRIDSIVARAARAFLAESGQGYAGLDELIEVALSNQLSAEGFQSVSRSKRLGERKSSGRASVAEVETATGPTMSAPGELGAAPPVPVVEGAAIDDSLFVMTNRLSPIKIAARALAIGVIELGEWPTLPDFHDRASAFAREIGTRLRREESRRWVGYPVGRDEAKARDRFVTSFTVSASGGRPRGPMVLLGLANVFIAPAVSVAGSRKRERNSLRVGLTDVGWRLAALPSPVLNECDGMTLSTPEADVMALQILSAPREREVVRGFLGLVRRSAGSQARLDELMAAREPGKSADLLVAERAALVGRLSELGMIEHEGRGNEARVSLTPRGRDLQTKLHHEAKENA